MIIIEAGLSERSSEGVEKAARVIPGMVATVAFFHDTVRTWVEAKGLPAEQEVLVHESLIPAAYLDRVVRKAPTAEAAAKLRAAVRAIQAPLLEADGLWTHLSPDRRRELTKLAQDCADLFQRSSSCVEGRNSRLSLWEHALRHISPKKLRVLTIVQNHFAKEPGAPSAAERFFGAPPADLFDYLLNRLDMPPRPRKRRHESKKQHTLDGDHPLPWPVL